MRNSTLFFIFLSLCCCLMVSMALDARRSQERDTEKTAASTEMVRILMLTDLCLFTEARYTRHPSMADINSPFQDHPMAMDHFPSGSLVNPPDFRRQAP